MRFRYLKSGLLLGFILASPTLTQAELRYDDDGNLIEDIPQQDYVNQGGFQVTPNQTPQENESKPPSIEEKIDRQDVTDWVNRNQNKGEPLREILEESIPTDTELPPPPTEIPETQYQQLLGMINGMNYLQLMPAELRPSLTNMDTLTWGMLESEEYTGDIPVVGAAIEDFGKRTLVTDHYLTRYNLFDTAKLLNDNGGVPHYYVEIEDIDPTASKGTYYIYEGDSAFMDTPYYQNSGAPIAYGEWVKANGKYTLDFSNITKTLLTFDITSVQHQLNFIPKEGSMDLGKDSPIMLVDAELGNYPGAVIPVPALLNSEAKALIGVNVNTVDGDSYLNNIHDKRILTFASNKMIGDREPEDWVNPNGNIRTVIPLTDSTYPYWSSQFLPELGKRDNLLFSIQGDKLVWADKSVFSNLPSGVQQFAVLSENGSYELLSLNIMTSAKPINRINFLKTSALQTDMPGFLNHPLVPEEHEYPYDLDFTKIANAETLAYLDSNLDTVHHVYPAGDTQYQSPVLTGDRNSLTKFANHEVIDVPYEDGMTLANAPEYLDWNRDGSSEVSIYANKVGSSTALVLTKPLTANNLTSLFKLDKDSMVVKTLLNSNALEEEEDDSTETKAPVNRTYLICGDTAKVDKVTGTCNQSSPYQIADSSNVKFQFRDPKATVKDIKVVSLHSLTDFSSNGVLKEYAPEFTYKLSDDKKTLEIIPKETTFNARARGEAVSGVSQPSASEDVKIPSFDLIEEEKLILEVTLDLEGTEIIQKIAVDILKEVLVTVETKWTMSQNEFNKDPQTGLNNDITLSADIDTLEDKVEEVWFAYFKDVQTANGTIEQELVEIDLVYGVDYVVVNNTVILSKETLNNIEPQRFMSVFISYGELDYLEVYLHIVDDRVETVQPETPNTPIDQFSDDRPIC